MMKISLKTFLIRQNIQSNIQNSTQMIKMFAKPFPKIRLMNTTTNESEKNY